MSPAPGTASLLCLLSLCPHTFRSPELLSPGGAYGVPVPCTFINQLWLGWQGRVGVPSSSVAGSAMSPLPSSACPIRSTGAEKATWPVFADRWGRTWKKCEALYSHGKVSVMKTGPQCMDLCRKADAEDRHPGWSQAQPPQHTCGLGSEIAGRPWGCPRRGPCSGHIVLCAVGLGDHSRGQ